MRTRDIGSIVGIVSLVAASVGLGLWMDNAGAGLFLFAGTFAHIIYYRGMGK